MKYLIIGVSNGGFQCCEENKGKDRLEHTKTQ